MKKFLIAAVVLLGSISLANAERFNLGVTVSGALFEADGAEEIFSGNHSSNTTTTKVTKNRQLKANKLRQQLQWDQFSQRSI